MMFKLGLAVLCLVFVVQAKTRISRLPESVWRIPKFRNVVDEKIVGGGEVIPNSIPFQVSLQYNYENFHFCGGAVASSKYIITAAHCCDGQTASALKVVAGEHNLEKEEGTEQAGLVFKIHMHPNYNPRNIYNDICVLELKYPLNMSDVVAAVSLPSPLQSFTGHAQVSGWGTLSSGGTSPSTLHSVSVPVLSDKVCRKAYGFSSIAKSMICAGEKGKDSCQGDSGGPLICNGYHCGVVSWGYGCAEADYPGVYTETSYFIDFLNEFLLT